MKIFTIVSPGSRVVCRRGGIYVVKGDSKEKILIPPDIDCVVVASSRVSISSKAIRVAARRGIDFVFLDFNGMPIARLYPPYINKTVAVRVSQYMLFQGDYGRKLAKEIVYTKIVNQVELVRYLAKNYREPSLREVAYQIDSIATELRALDPKILDRDILMSFESRAAKVYWQTIASLLPDSLGFRGRDHESRDLFNMALNYGYGILYSVCERSLLFAGLDPYLGVLHTPKSGKPSLTLDFVEMFRAIAVDKPLVINVKKIKLAIQQDRLDTDSRKSVASIVLENLRQRYLYIKTSKREELSEIIKRDAWDLAYCIREGLEYRGARLVI
ncbi:MAG: CRISPR-associated endonuclease Cas1 [Ignisphaera sp.]